jgi:hypothetical protein
VIEVKGPEKQVSIEMEDSDPAKEACPSLLDLIVLSQVRASLLQHLKRNEKIALRQSCRGLASEVGSDCQASTRAGSVFSASDNAVIAARAYEAVHCMVPAGREGR